jgi:hypothetical protein
MKIKLVTFIAILSPLCLNTLAETSEPPPPIDEKITVNATLKVDPVQGIQIGSIIAKFEKTTLGEILKTVGVGSIEHAGEAGDSQYWLCYSLPSQRVWFISHGEMGGPDHALTQVQAISTKSTSESKTCPTLPIRFQSISMNFGWIGSTKDNLLKALGQPSKKQDGRYYFYYLGKEPGVYEGKKMEWDVIGYIEVTTTKDVVSSVFASHVTSY